MRSGGRNEDRFAWYTQMTPIDQDIQCRYDRHAEYDCIVTFIYFFAFIFFLVTIDSMMQKRKTR